MPVNIPAGVDTGSVIRIEGRGNNAVRAFRKLAVSYHSLVVS